MNIICKIRNSCNNSLIKEKKKQGNDMLLHRKDLSKQELNHLLKNTYHNEVTYPLIWKYGDVYKNKKKEIKKITGIKPNKLIYGPGYFEIRF